MHAYTCLGPRVWLESDAIAPFKEDAEGNSAVDDPCGLVRARDLPSRQSI
jgi:hypothetical protein